MSEDNNEIYETLDLSEIDADYYGSHIYKMWQDASRDREHFLKRREEWTAMWRSLEPQYQEGPWKNSANFNVPLILTYGKAIHARLWQLFSDRYGFFSAFARREAFKGREQSVQEFMNFVWNHWANNRSGCKPTMIDFLWNLAFDGSGIVKLIWRRDVHQYLDKKDVRVTETKLVFDRTTLSGREETSESIETEDVVEEKIVEYPELVNIDIEDIILPVGQADPQTSDWVIHRVVCDDDYLKQCAEDDKFDKDVVAEVIQYRQNLLNAFQKETTIKEERRYFDGYNNTPTTEEREGHVILEYYGKIFVEKEFKKDLKNDIEKMPQECIVWVHEQTRKVLGWTYLYRVSPSGQRPIFKADFLNFPNRSFGVGVAELLMDINININALYNLRIDNGTISTLGWGVYRSSSGLKPDVININPGELYPVDDVQDIRMMQFPYLGSFGQIEEQNLKGYGEGLLSLNELNLGQIPRQIGALRNATGSNLLASESSIQLQIHFDRLALMIDKLLQAMFRLCRQRMPEELFYRVTGSLGDPIFGKVARQDLEGEFDFEIKVDILGQSRVERQQAATLKMQTLLNPAFTQTGIVQPKNMYALARDYLKANNVDRVDEYITKPQDYTGEIITAGERFFRIMAGLLSDIEDTVRFDENHQEALKTYEAFKANDNIYGLLDEAAVAAVERVIARHKQYLEAQNARGMANNFTGMQLPQGGFDAVSATLGGGGETLQAQQTNQGLGTPNGPMV
jgi:hypothetical protein